LNEASDDLAVWQSAAKMAALQITANGNVNVKDATQTQPQAMELAGRLSF
jgi:hypothetical protein